MSGNKNSEAIWDLLIRTLPENNQERLDVEKKALCAKYHGIEKLKAGTIWRLNCGSCFQWVSDNHKTWVDAIRICNTCGHDEFEADEHEHDGYVGLFLVCGKCGAEQLDNLDHMTEVRELAERWSVVMGWPTEKIPALLISSFSQWSKKEIAMNIVDKLQPSQEAERVRSEALRLSKEHPGFWSIKDRQEITAGIIKELENGASIALRSPSLIFFSVGWDRDVYIEKIDENSYEYALEYTDGLDLTPLLILG